MNNQAAKGFETETVMGWVEKLHEVGTPILVRREAIERNVMEAKALELQAKGIMAQAYRDSLALEATIREKWTDEEINKAKKA